MKNVHGLVSLALVLGLASGCGRVTTISSISSSASLSAAALASTPQLWVQTNTNFQVFLVTVSTGNLTSVPVDSVNQNVTIDNSVPRVSVGTWTYELNAANGSIDQYATSNLNVLVHSFPVTGGVVSMGIAVNN